MVKIDYSEDDKKVLDYYFTNLDKPIFATKNFHPEVWALMQARYSRAREGLRESFLKLLKEDDENFQNLKEEIEKTKGGLKAQHATEKAIQFMEKWVLGYGHSSVSEGAVIGLSLEGVSILATKVIEDNRLSSFIEKSTRYVSFDEKSFYVDQKLLDSKYGKEVQEFIDYLFKVYCELQEPVLEHVMKVAPREEGTNEAAWKRACAARRFDDIRYLLPAGTKTSLGWTVNARQLAHGISKLLSHPLKEMNDIGLMIKEEASKVLPSLLRYADKNEFYAKTNKEMREFVKDIEIKNDNQEQVAIVNAPNNPEETILASILFKYMNKPYSKVLEYVKSLDKKQREEIYDKYNKNMSPFDYPLRELEHEQFTFEVIMDYGSFRDLQRHRICTQTNPVFTTDLNYDVPQDIIDAGFESKYKEVMDKAKELYDKIKGEFPLESQYIIPLGYNKRYLVTMNLREIHHFVKVRTTPLAHPSYRLISHKFYECIKEKYPLLAKYIQSNYEDEKLGRLKSEEKTEKLEKIGPL